jgi:hypothetical protein
MRMLYVCMLPAERMLYVCRLAPEASSTSRMLCICCTCADGCYAYAGSLPKLLPAMRMLYVCRLVYADVCCAYAVSLPKLLPAEGRLPERVC